MRLRRALLVFCAFVAVTILVFTTQFNTTTHSFVKGGLLDSSLHHLTSKISNWFHGQVLGLTFEERFCHNTRQWNATSRHPPVHVVARQLNIKDGDSVFVNGVHCGEWNRALKHFYPNIVLYGIDKDPESVEYVKTLANGTYSVSQPFELDTSGITRQFDHAIIDNLLHVYTPELQCRAITQMIPLLKAGGSLYIGKSFEKYGADVDEVAVEKYVQGHLHRQLLETCYWSSNCLLKREDIVEILYSKDIDFMTTQGTFDDYIVDDKSSSSHSGRHINLSNNSYSVFIYKNILLTQHKDHGNNILPESRYSEQFNHKCTRSKAKDATERERIDKEGIKKAVKDMKLRGLDMHHR